ncbi:hypothetical protein GCM10023331_17730 [Algivirga pacifica]|uniref:Uncharacterized protein n=1 Tax=Algivirga pacifica TaxID=1162670 RepID=A0ABP9DE68_9BACT
MIATLSPFFNGLGFISPGVEGVAKAGEEGKKMPESMAVLNRKFLRFIISNVNYVWFDTIPRVR